MRELINESGSLGAADETVIINVAGHASMAAQLTGTWVGTVTWQGTVGAVDGTYVSVSATNAATGATATTATANAVYLIACGGFSYIRANMTAYTSGTATVKLQSILTAGTSNNVSVTADTEFPAHAAGADNTATPDTTSVYSFGMVYDGATWDFQRGTAADGTLVNLGTNNDVSLNAGSALVGDVGISGARTSGGTTIFRSIDLDESEEEIKATAGQVYWMHVINLANAVRYLKFYNATAANVTVGTTTPVLTLPIPTLATTNGNGFVFCVPNGIAFSTAITAAATTGLADNDTGAPGANEIVINLGYA